MPILSLAKLERHLYDVRAHLAGDIPTAEISNCRALFESLGFKPQTIFTPRPEDDRYHDFCESISHRPAIADAVEKETLIPAKDLKKGLKGRQKQEKSALSKLILLKSGLQDDLLTGRVRVPETLMEGAVGV